MTPLISIITPSYNQARYLERTLSSVLDQAAPALEYLVVDGLSTDGSADVIQRYADRLTWWVSEKDAGQAEAINKGLRRARGEYIAWLNSDDYYLPGAIATALRVFEQHPEAGLVYGDVLSIDADDRPFNTQSFRPYSLLDLMSFRIISQPAVFMRRSVLVQAGYLDESYHLLLDHHLWIRMARRAPLIHIPQTLAAARYHAEAKNLVKAAAFGAEAFRIGEWMKTDAQYAAIYRQNEKRILAGAHRLNAFYLTDGGRPFAALKSYWQSFCYHPSTALADWKHVLLALAEGLGLKYLRGAYLRLRQRQQR